MDQAPPDFVPRPAEGLRHRNVIAMFAARVKRSAHQPALRTKEGGAWRTLTWAQWQQASRTLAAGLLGLGVTPGQRKTAYGTVRFLERTRSSGTRIVEVDGRLAFVAEGDIWYVEETAQLFDFYFIAIQKGLAEQVIKPYPVELIGEMLYRDMVAVMNGGTIKLRLRRKPASQLLHIINHRIFLIACSDTTRRVKMSQTHCRTLNRAIGLAIAYHLPKHSIV